MWPGNSFEREKKCLHNIIAGGGGYNISYNAQICQEYNTPCAALMIAHLEPLEGYMYFLILNVCTVLTRTY